MRTIWDFCVLELAISVSGKKMICKIASSSLKVNDRKKELIAAYEAQTKTKNPYLQDTI